MNRLRLIAHRRVSTVRQGVSGLGLEAQDAALAFYVMGGKKVHHRYRLFEMERSFEDMHVNA